MKFFRQILILFFATVIFTGTVGVNVFAHYCKIDGVDYSFILPKEEHCKKEKVETSCCLSDVKTASEAIQIEEDCCSDEVTSFKIASEIFQKEVGNFQLLSFFSSYPSGSYVFVSEKIESSLTYFNAKEPTPKWGRALLIQNQVFRL